MDNNSINKKTIARNFLLLRDGRSGLMLSDGIGIDKMRPLIQEFIQDFSDVNKMVSINLGENGYNYKKELDEFAMNNLRFTSIYTNQTHEFYKIINSELQKIMFQTGLVPNIYLSGRDSFVNEVYQGLEEAGFEKKNIIIDTGILDPSCNGSCSSCCSSC